uniref:CcoQ/FixQ family Cbb3-type cytochrome c oxidase assembly chaperone n=1 Tax=Bursaphelenchus xylophilus TaxID=6326 RepID=A0A1I7S0T7_BURXY
MYVQTTKLGDVCVVFAALIVLLFFSVVIWLRIKQHKAQRIQAISVQRPKRAFQWNDDRDTLPIVQLP